MASVNVSSGEEDSRQRSRSKAKSTTKKMRRWDADGMADEDDGAVLDYSATSDPSQEGGPERKIANEDIDFDAEASGTRTGKGQFVLKDLEDEVHSILAASNAKKAETAPSTSGGVVGSGISAISGLFRNIVGGKVLTKEDLIKPMKGMEEHLVKKNIAQEAAVRLCEGVERELIGVKTGNFESMLPQCLV